MLAADAALLAANRSHWFVNEVLHAVKRTLKRVDVTARSFVALVEEGSCFAGSFLELALAADRTYALSDPGEKVCVQLGVLNAGLLPMGNGLSRLQTRFLGDSAAVEKALGRKDAIPSKDAEDLGLVTFAPDDIDWDRRGPPGLEERASHEPGCTDRHGGEPALRRVRRRWRPRSSAASRPGRTGFSSAPTPRASAARSPSTASRMRPEFDWART